MTLMESHKHALRLLHQPPIVVSPGTTLRDVAEIIDEEWIGVVLVVENDLPVGIVGERDLVVALARSADPDRVPIRELMIDKVVSVDEDAEALDIAKTMLNHHIRHVVVTRGGDDVLGVVSVRDVLAALVTDCEAEELAEIPR